MEVQTLLQPRRKPLRPLLARRIRRDVEGELARIAAWPEAICLAQEERKWFLDELLPRFDVPAARDGDFERLGTESRAVQRRPWKRCVAWRWGVYCVLSESLSLEPRAFAFVLTSNATAVGYFHGAFPCVLVQLHRFGFEIPFELDRKPVMLILSAADLEWFSVGLLCWTFAIDVVGVAWIYLLLLHHNGQK